MHFKHFSSTYILYFECNIQLRSMLFNLICLVYIIRYFCFDKNSYNKFNCRHFSAFILIQKQYCQVLKFNLHKNGTLHCFCLFIEQEEHVFRYRLNRLLIYISLKFSFARADYLLHSQSLIRLLFLFVVSRIQLILV